MQVPIHSAVPASQLTQPTRAPDSAAPVRAAETFVLDKGIDFSRITPRQLLAYVNEQQRLGTLDPMEGGSLIDQVGVSQWDDAPDVPFDLRARLQGTMEFHLDTKSGLASWYAGLIDRLATLEAQSIRLSAEV